MKRVDFLFILVVVLCGISGCQRGVNHQMRSVFYSTFSLGEIVTRHEKFLLPESRSLSGTEAGPATSPYQKHEEMTVQIDPANIPSFMEAVKTDLQKALLDSNARIEGQGGSFQDPTGGPIDFISYRYSDVETRGIVNLYGVRGEGTSYIIIVIVTEN